MSDSLENIRSQIDALDNQIIELLARRMRHVVEVGQYKRLHDLPALDETRWKQAAEARLEHARTLGLSEEFVVELYELIHKYTVRIEKDLGAK